MLRHSLSTRERIEDYLGTGHDDIEINSIDSTSTRYHLYIVKNYGIYNTMIREKLKHKGIVVDCSGPDGNAFQLLKLASDLAKQLEWSEKETRMMLTEMKSSDYEHLILTFDKHFGWHVTLEFDVHPSSKYAR